MGAALRVNKVAVEEVATIVTWLLASWAVVVPKAKRSVLVVRLT